MQTNRKLYYFFKKI